MEYCGPEPVHPPGAAAARRAPGVPPVDGAGPGLSNVRNHPPPGAGAKHIYIYSPCGAVRDKRAFARGIAWLEAQGHRVEVDADARATHTRFAGDDATRLAAIHRAAASGADVALISRGGYGLARILPAIRYPALARAIAGGTQFVGFSDFSALQLALLAQTGAISWAGPALGADFGCPADAVDEIMQACFDDLLAGRGRGTGWRLPRARPAAPGPAPALPGGELQIDGATLWGGNLTVLAALVGTPYLPAPEAGVLFLEDVHEHPYRIERLLTQLLHAGVLARQKALLLGQFSNYTLSAHDKGYTLETALAWLRSQIGVPLLGGLPFGHVATKVLLPVGARVSLSVQGRDALLCWEH